MISSNAAIQILTNICQLLDGNPPSTAAIKDNPRELDAINQGWWILNQGEYTPDAPIVPSREDNPLKTPNRTSAYLRAYLAIAGDRIPARGIPLAGRKYMLLDKGIMKALLIHNPALISLEKGFFQLTEDGRKYLQNHNIQPTSSSYLKVAGDS